MTTRVVHIGTDQCHRVLVLESAGYEVDGCNSVEELQRAFKRVESLAAVLVSESQGAVYRDLIREVRECSDAPLVLFRETLHRFTEPDEEPLFDLEVPVLEPPEAWLPDLATLIARSRELQAQSRELRSQAQRLCGESAAAREKSWLERLRSREVRTKIPNPAGFIRGPEDDETS
jgi:hypothetical protein